MRILHRLAKFLDIRPGRKAPPRPKDHNGCDGRICIRLHHRIKQALPYGLAQRVDWRVIDLNDGDRTGR